MVVTFSNKASKLTRDSQRTDNIASFPVCLQCHPRRQSGSIISLPSGLGASAPEIWFRITIANRFLRRGKPNYPPLSLDGHGQCQSGVRPSLIRPRDYVASWASWYTFKSVRWQSDIWGVTTSSSSSTSFYEKKKSGVCVCVCVCGGGGGVPACVQRKAAGMPSDQQSCHQRTHRYTTTQQSLHKEKGGLLDPGGWRITLQTSMPNRKQYEQCCTIPNYRMYEFQTGCKHQTQQHSTSLHN